MALAKDKGIAVFANVLQNGKNQLIYDIIPASVNDQTQGIPALTLKAEKDKLLNGELIVNSPVYVVDLEPFQVFLDAVDAETESINNIFAYFGTDGTGEASAELFTNDFTYPVADIVDYSAQ